MAASIRKRTLPSGKVVHQAVWTEYAGGPQRAKNFPTKAAAKLHLSQVQVDLARGVYVDPDTAGVTLGDYVQTFLGRQVWRPATRTNGERALGRAVDHWGPGRPLATIKQADVQAYVTALTATLAPSTIALELKYVGALFRMAVDEGLTGRDRSAGMKRPSSTTGKVDPLTVDEVRQLEAAAPAWFRVAIVLGADLGLRQSELRGLSVEHVRFLRREVRIDRQALRHAAGYGPPKTANSIRTVPVDPSTLEQVSAHLATFGASDDGLVLHRAGRPVASTTFEHAFRATRSAAGLASSVRFHDLRHHAASELLGDGLSVVAVAAILGDTPATVLSTYGHLVASDDDRVRASMRRRRTWTPSDRGHDVDTTHLDQPSEQG